METFKDDIFMIKKINKGKKTTTPESYMNLPATLTLFVYAMILTCEIKHENVRLNKY